MLRFMLDTNLCVRIIRDRPAALRQRFSNEAASLSLFDVVLYELLYGAERSTRPAENRRVVEQFAGRLVVLPFDSDAAGHVANIRHELEQRGQVIGPYDLLMRVMHAAGDFY